MTLLCPPIDPGLGTVLRVSSFLDCRARMLGEAGYQSLAGNLVGSGVVVGLLTIFVAVIGYRLLLGEEPGLRDGVGWALRLGFALAFATAWPAFQVVVYRVAVDGPVELAAALAPAGGASVETLDARAQLAYDTIRLGRQRAVLAAPQVIQAPEDRQAADALALAQAYQFEAPMPQTATAFLLVSVGMTGALRMAIGFLLAIGPLVFLFLLFAATTGLVVGWVRALVGAALATTGATVVAALTTLFVESELARLQSLNLAASAEAADATALSGFVVLFALVMIVTVVVAARVTAALDWQAAVSRVRGLADHVRPSGEMPMRETHTAQALSAATRSIESTRVSSIVDALGEAARRDGARESGMAGTARGRSGWEGRVPPTGQGMTQTDSSRNAAGRRDLGRGTALARRRDDKR